MDATLNLRVFFMTTILLVPSYGQAGCEDVERLAYLLPPYCLARCASGLEQQAKWDQKLGKGTFLHVHHYCFALANEIQLNLNLMLSDLNYVISFWPDNSILKPLALYKKARILDLFPERLSKGWGKQSDAIGLYEKAIRLNPRYVAAYMALSENAARRGDHERAKAYLSQGLKYNPKSDLLNKRLRDLNK